MSLGGFGRLFTSSDISSHGYLLFSLESSSIKSSIHQFEHLLPYTFTVGVMFSNTFISFSFFSILCFVGFSIGDVNTAFDVGVVLGVGGCSPDEVAKIEAAFTEAIEITGLIQNAISSMQTGTEAPAVGWMFNSLFGIQATEDLQDRGIGRPQEQTDALATMQSQYSPPKETATSDPIRSHGYN